MNTWLRIYTLTALAAVYTAQLITRCDASSCPLMALFMHANIFHLAANSWVAWYVIRSYRLHAAWVLFLGIIFGTVGIAIDGDTVGFSAAIFAMMGVNWFSIDNRYNRAVMAATLALSAILPMLSFLAHAVPFALGLAVAFATESKKFKLWLFTKTLNDETKKVPYKKGRN